jgi:hypothetical protein
VRNVASNLREKDDWKSSAMGGFASGSIIGLASKRADAHVGQC